MKKTEKKVTSSMKKPVTKKTTTKTAKAKTVKAKVLNSNHKAAQWVTVEVVEKNIVKYLRLVGGIIALLGGLYLLADIALGLVLITIGTVALSNFMSSK